MELEVFAVWCRRNRRREYAWFLRDQNRTILWGGRYYGPIWNVLTWVGSLVK